MTSAHRSSSIHYGIGSPFLHRSLWYWLTVPPAFTMISVHRSSRLPFYRLTVLACTAILSHYSNHHPLFHSHPVTGETVVCEKCFGMTRCGMYCVCAGSRYLRQLLLYSDVLDSWLCWCFALSLVTGHCCCTDSCLLCLDFSPHWLLPLAHSLSDVIVCRCSVMCNSVSAILL